MFCKEQNMAQILASSTKWLMKITKDSPCARPITSKMWNSLLLRQNEQGAPTSSAKFRVLAIKSENSTINRLENLLNLDITPHTDKIIAEYIWYELFPLSCFCLYEGSRALSI